MTDMVLEFTACESFFLPEQTIDRVSHGWTGAVVGSRTGHGHCPDTKQEVMPEHSFLPFLFFYGGCCG